jgi:hypothetical protein
LKKRVFKYPPDWKVIAPQQPSVKGADTFTIQSSNGQVKIIWVSAITGLGGGCGDKCPIYNVIEKTPIPGSQGLYVVSAVVDAGNGNVTPWIAVQDGNGLLSSGKKAVIGTFTGRNNAGGNSENYEAVFGLSNIYGEGPTITQSQVADYFKGNEVQEAKQILLSLRY